MPGDPNLPPIFVNAEPIERADLRPTDLAPRGFVRIPGVGFVHRSVFLVLTGALGYGLYRHYTAKPRRRR